MKRTSWMVGLVTMGALTTTSCGLEDQYQYVAPFAAEVVLLNIPTEDLQAYGVNAEPIAQVMVALGHLTSPGTASSSPFSGEGVSGATVTIVDGEGKSFPLVMDESTPGVYLLSSQQEAGAGFKYTVGASYQVKIAYDGQEYWSRFVAADGVALTSPAELGTYHEPGTPLTVSWEPARDAAVLAVFDAEGNQVYDNLPRDLNDLYGFITQSEVVSATVPGDRFEKDQVYGIGVAGLERVVAAEATFSKNLNWLISNAVTGTAVVTAVTTAQIPDELPDEIPQ